jgi:hypothetical protein
MLTTQSANRKRCYLLLSSFMLLVGCEKKIRCDHYSDFVAAEAHGTVTTKFLDSASHMLPTINYTTITGKKGFDNRIGNYLPDVYDTLEVGDLLNKDIGSSTVTVTKRGKPITFETNREDWCPE